MLAWLTVALVLGQAPDGGAPNLRSAAPLRGPAAFSDGGVGNAWVDGARGLLGTAYQWGGRKRGEGIDCLGVVLAAAEHAGRCGWKSYPVNPTELVAGKLLGAPVKGASPVASGALDLEQLRPGDVVMLVAADQNPAEPAIAQLDGGSVWVWHVGVYSGQGRWIVGDHFAAQTVEVDLRQYLTEHADTYSGVFVVRPPGARPAKCRQHAPLVPRSK